jgi:hypothetical protein
MIWFTWRQFRTQAYVALAALVVVGATLAAVRHQIADLYAASGLAGCQNDCAPAIDNFLTAAGQTWFDRVSNAAAVLVIMSPAVLGAFWGAPLIARELETGTYRLAWSQSVTRTRWLATKVISGGLASVATVGLFSLAETWSASRLDQVSAHRYSPVSYGSHGIVPVGCAAFAFALGVTVGLLIRRTVPAMAATLAVYAAAAIAMPLWVRGHLMPTSTLTEPLDGSSVRGIMISNHDQTMTVLSDVEADGGWVLSIQTITPSGQVFTGPADPSQCNVEGGKDTCFTWVNSLHLRQVLTYHPLSQYWPLQFIETGVFLAAALALTGLCFWWIRRRLT